MKTVLNKLSDEQARKEVDSRTYWLFGTSIVTLLIFWPVAFVVVVLGPRNFMLTYRNVSLAAVLVTSVHVFLSLVVQSQ